MAEGPDAQSEPNGFVALAKELGVIGWACLAVVGALGVGGYALLRRVSAEWWLWTALGAAAILATYLLYKYAVRVVVAAFVAWPVTLIAVLLGGFIGGGVGAVLGLSVAGIVALLVISR